VGVQAAHAGDLVAQALLGEDLGDAVFSHPGLVAVPKSVGRQPEFDRQPAGQGRAVGDGLDAPAGRWPVVRVEARWGGGPGGGWGAGPAGGVGDDKAGGAALRGFVAAVAGGAEDAAGVVAAPVVAAVRA
jgi:hypothetical protein